MSAVIGQFELQDIKSEKLTATQLEELYARTGSYAALFSKRAKQYQAMGLKDKVLQEKDIARLLLQEYTFLKRPVIIWGKDIFIGSEKKSLNALRKKIAGEKL